MATEDSTKPIELNTTIGKDIKDADAISEDGTIKDSDSDNERDDMNNDNTEVDKSFYGVNVLHIEESAV